MEDRFVSADSHVLEPGDLWHRKAPAAFKDRVIRVSTADCKSNVEGEGIPFSHLEMGFAAGRRGDDFKNDESLTWEERPVAGYSVAERLDAMKEDGVSGEVLYPTLALALHSIPDARLQQLSCDIYNEWLAELCAGSRGRLIGIGILPMGDLPNAAAELEKIAALGLRGAMIPLWVETPYNKWDYEPLWEAAEHAQLPLSIHVGTGAGPIAHSGPGAGGLNLTRAMWGMELNAAAIIWGGALERHPELRVVFVEAGIGFVAPLLERLDDKWEQHRGWIKPSLEQPPSQYFARQCLATFERDRAGLEVRSMYGVQSIMWATDYPHAESSWPDSREIAESQFKSAMLSDDERAAITHANVERLYDWSPVEAGMRESG